MSMRCSAPSMLPVRHGLTSWYFEVHIGLLVRDRSSFRLIEK